MSKQEREELRGVPLVIVATILADATTARETRSRFDSAIRIQLHGAKVMVENVLRGNLQTGPDEIFYYHWNNVVAGNAVLGKWKAGDRYIFFLKRDSGVLRTSCEFWRDACTIQVKSGKHPGYQPTVGTSIEEAIADIILTKGEGITDKQFFSSLSYSASELPAKFTVPKLKTLYRSAPDEAARSEVCTSLQSWNEPCG